MQEVLIILAFLTAVYFVSRKVYLEFSAKDGCAQGCAKCHITDPEVSKS